MDTTTALAARQAPLEYWFLKLNTPELAFLADLIIRPAGAEVRLSVWVDGHGRVIRGSGTPDVSTAGARVGDSVLGTSASTGTSGCVSWDLRYEIGPVWVDPGRMVRALRPFDMELVSAPGTRFTGRIVVDGRAYAVDATPGLIAHYWGKRLPRRWYWLSVNTPSLDIDVVVSHARLWSLPGPAIRAGYLYLDDRERRRSIVSPLNGLVRASGQPGGAVIVSAWAPAGNVRLRCAAPPAAFNDLGEGIRQTLIGDCEIGGQRISGVAGIETRNE